MDTRSIMPKFQYKLPFFFLEPNKLQNLYLKFEVRGYSSWSAIVRDPKTRIKGSNEVNSKVERTIQSSV